MREELPLDMDFDEKEIRIVNNPTFRCTNDACWMGEYQADVNGAVNIADRYLGGESRSREHENDDDSAEDGGRLTAPQDSQADATTQETLGTYAS